MCQKGGDFGPFLGGQKRGVKKGPILGPFQRPLFRLYTHGCSLSYHGKRGATVHA